MSHAAKGPIHDPHFLAIWYLEAGGQLIVSAQFNNDSFFSDNSVSWQSLADWLLCSMWCQLELGWGWYIQNLYD